MQGMVVLTMEYALVWMLKMLTTGREEMVVALMVVALSVVEVEDAPRPAVTMPKSRASTAKAVFQSGLAACQVVWAVAAAVLQ